MVQEICGKAIDGTGPGRMNKVLGGGEVILNRVFIGIKESRGQR